MTVLVASVAYVLMLALICLVWPIALDSAGEREVIVGPWTGEVIVLASITACLVMLTVIVFAVPARRWWWVLLGPLRILAIGAAALGGLAFSLTNDSVTPIVADGCETGYVATESSFLLGASGSVRRLDGVIGISVGQTQVDDGHKPFEERSYIAVTEGDSLRVWNTFQSSTEPLTTASTPSFILPRLISETGCGLEGGVGAASRPLPVPDDSPATPEGGSAAVLPATDARAEVVRMVQHTLDAAGETVTDAAGARVSAPLPADLPCDGRTAYALDIRADDNSASYAAVLAAWDSAGYAKDRAMQEDLRDNGVVRLSARDRSSIDGLLHFSLTAACRAR